MINFKHLTKIFSFPVIRSFDAIVIGQNIVAIFLYVSNNSEEIKLIYCVINCSKFSLKKKNQKGAFNACPLVGIMHLFQEIHSHNSDVILARACGVPAVCVRRSTAGNDVVATIFIRLFFFPPVFFLSPSRPFLIEGVLGSKNLFSES